MANLVALALVIGLAVVPYNYGTGRWMSAWTTNTWGIGLMMFVLFMPWYLVATGIGAERALVPVAMLVLAGGFGIGYSRH